MDIVNWGGFYDRMMQALFDGDLPEAQRQGRLLLSGSRQTDPLWIRAAYNVVHNME